MKMQAVYAIHVFDGSEDNVYSRQGQPTLCLGVTFLAIMSSRCIMRIVDYAVVKI